MIMNEKVEIFLIFVFVRVCGSLEVFDVLD